MKSPSLASRQALAGLGLDAVFNDVRDGLVVISYPDESILLANRAASELCAIPTDIILPVPVGQVFADPAVALTARKCADYSEHPLGLWAGHPQEILQSEVAGRDGTTRDVELHFCRVADQTQSGPLVLVVIRPARRARSAAGTPDRVAELETDARTLAVFFSEAAHEINTPLTIIALQAQLLRRTLPEVLPAQDHALEAIKSNIQRLVLLAQDLGDLARAETGRLVLHAVPVDLAALVALEVDGFQPIAQHASLTLASSLSPALVIGEALRLRQIVSNLLANAVKFTPPGGEIHIQLSTTPDKLAMVSIRDNGQGMRSEDLGRLFQPFMRIQAPDKAKKVGTGLGLYLSKRIAEAHGGTMGCSSPGLGKGMTFWLKLPLASPEAAASALSEATRIAPQAPGGALVPASPSLLGADEIP